MENPESRIASGKPSAYNPAISDSKPVRSPALLLTPHSLRLLRRWALLLLALGFLTLAVGAFVLWYFANWTESGLRAEIVKDLPPGSTPAAVQNWAQSHHFQVTPYTYADGTPVYHISATSPPKIPAFLSEDFFYVEFHFDQEHKLKSFTVQERCISF